MKEPQSILMKNQDNTRESVKKKHFEELHKMGQRVHMGPWTKHPGYHKQITTQATF